MLNILFNPKKAQRHPLEMMLVGFFYASVSIFLATWIFPEYASLTIVFFTVFSCLYVVQGAIKTEEKNEQNYKTEEWRLKKHSRTIYFLLFLFLGFVFAFTFWTIVLPQTKVSMIFELQYKSIEGIKANIVSGSAIETTSTILKIFANNIEVLLISIIFAIFYGAGAIYILVWNASVMGYLIGILAKNTFGITALPVIFTKYFLHGIPEIIAYLIGALAGGILYVAIWKGDLLNKEKNKTIIIDILILVGIAILILIAAALIEIFLSPLI
jgi:stage II sporulation protein M